MTTYYLSSSGDGSAITSGWSTAATTLAAIISGGLSTNDEIVVSDSHSESTAGTTHTIPNNVKILCVTPSGATGYTGLSTGAVLTRTSGYNLNGTFYMYGLTWQCSSAASTSCNFGQTTGNVQTYDHCSLHITGAGASSGMYFGSLTANAATSIRFNACDFKFAAVNQQIGINNEVYMTGCSWASGGSTPTGLFNMGSGARGGTLTVRNFDFSNIGTSTNIIKTINQGNANATFRKCKMPTSWVGDWVTSGQQKAGSRVEAWNCDYNNTSGNFYIDDYHYSCEPVTSSIYMNGGATQDGNNMSFALTTTSNCSYPFLVGASVPLRKVVPTSALGNTVTVSVEIAVDYATTIDNDMIWLEVELVESTGDPLGTIKACTPAAVIDTPSAQPTSSETWTGTGGWTDPQYITLSVDITPAQETYLLGRVMVAEPSLTIYINPELIIT